MEAMTTTMSQAVHVTSLLIRVHDDVVVGALSAVLEPLARSANAQACIDHGRIDLNENE